MELTDVLVQCPLDNTPVVLAYTSREDLDNQLNSLKCSTCGLARETAIIRYLEAWEAHTGKAVAEAQLAVR